MSRRGSVLFSAPRAHQGGDHKTIEVLRQIDDVGLRFERVGRLCWRKFENDWSYYALTRDGACALLDKRIHRVSLREAKRLVDERYGVGDHPK